MTGFWENDGQFKNLSQEHSLGESTLLRNYSSKPINKVNKSVKGL